MAVTISVYPQINARPDQAQNVTGSGVTSKYGLDVFVLGSLVPIATTLEPSSNDQVKNLYGEANAVPTAVETLVASYTVPALKSSHVLRVGASGTNIGDYRIYVNGIRKARGFTAWSQLSTNFELSAEQDKGLVINAGDVISIKVVNPKAAAGDYNANIVVIEVG